MSNDVIPVSYEQLPSTQIGTDEQFAELAKGGNFLGRLQLYTKSKVNALGLIPQGHYGIPESNEEITDLGTSVNFLPLARRPKAIDMTDLAALIMSYDMESAEFKRIKDAAGESNSHCQFGPSFLIYEQSTCRFLEFFCGNKSNKQEAKKLFPFLPLTQATIDAKAAAGNDVSGLMPHDPLPVTMKVKLAENKFGTWHVPVVTKCSLPFEHLPSEEQMVQEIVKFLTVKDNGVERVEEVKPARAR